MLDENHVFSIIFQWLQSLQIYPLCVCKDTNFLLIGNFFCSRLSHIKDKIHENFRAFTFAKHSQFTNLTFLSLLSSLCSFVTGELLVGQYWEDIGRILGEYKNFNSGFDLTLFNVYIKSLNPEIWCFFSYLECRQFAQKLSDGSLIKWGHSGHEAGT